MMSTCPTPPLPWSCSAYSPGSEAGDCKRPAGRDPSSWGVEEVVWFIKDSDPQALGPHAEAFRKHVGPEYSHNTAQHYTALPPLVLVLGSEETVMKP